MLFGICTGNVNSTPIVFLHGFLGSHRDFFPIIDHLQEQYTCLSLDLPGHGKSLYVPSSDPFHTVIGKIYQTLQLHDFKRVHLVGYSLGGRLALLFARQFPQLIDQLIILSVHPGLTSKEKKRREVLDQQWELILKRDGLETFLKLWYDQPLFGRFKDFSTIIDERKQNDPSALTEVLRNLSVAKQPSLWNELNQFPMPILFMFGEKDQKYLLVKEKIRENHSQIAVSTVIGASHAVHLENPLECAETIKNNLKG